MQIKNKSAFTLIEVVFVIVVTGILAVSAIAKLSNLSMEAKKTKVLSYVGTLNRTVGATMYLIALDNANAEGEIANATYCGVLSTPVNNYIAPIREVNIAADCKLTFVDVPNPTINIFVDGTSRKTPKWTVEF